MIFIHPEKMWNSKLGLKALNRQLQANIMIRCQKVQWMQFGPGNWMATRDARIVDGGTHFPCRFIGTFNKHNACNYVIQSICCPTKTTPLHQRRKLRYRKRKDFSTFDMFYSLCIKELGEHSIMCTFDYMVWVRKRTIPT
jgi:hypothetical protein